MPCDLDRFESKKTARVMFRCPLSSTKKCRGIQSMNCSRALRRLIPIWRTSPIYRVLHSQVGNTKHVHGNWRTWFSSGGKTLRDRRRRVGLACRQLRARAALLIQWVGVLMRQGWISRRRTERVQPVPLNDNGRYARLMERRRKELLFGGGYPSSKEPPGVLTAAGPPRGGAAAWAPTCCTCAKPHPTWHLGPPAPPTAEGAPVGPLRSRVLSSFFSSAELSAEEIHMDPAGTAPASESVSRWVSPSAADDEFLAVGAISGKSLHRQLLLKSRPLAEEPCLGARTTMRRR